MNLLRKYAVPALVAVMLCLVSATTRADGQKPLAEADVTKLLELQIDGKTIVNRIEKAGIQFGVTPDVLERLKKTGASDEVVTALQNAGKKGSSAAKPPVTLQDV